MPASAAGPGSGSASGGLSRTLHRVLVTGVGAITPIGNDVPSYWDGLRSGRNGITRVTLCEPDGLPVQIAGEVKGFDPERGEGDNKRQAQQAAALAMLLREGVWRPISDD